MDKDTTELLKQLAAQLGTTTEYLWRVLVNQAHIDAIITIIQSIFLLTISIIILKLHLKFIKKDASGRTSYYNSEALTVAMSMVAIVGVVFIFVVVLNIDEIINGFFNPEYWALEHILNKVK